MTELTKERILETIQKAYINTITSNPYYSVFSGRRGDGVAKSYFFDKTIDITKLIEILKTATTTLPQVVTVGRLQSWTFKCQPTPTGIGTEYIPLFIGGHKHKIVDYDYYKAIAVDKNSLIGHPTDFVTVVLRRVDDDTEYWWELVDAYPGESELSGDWSGLKKSEVYDGCDIGKRNIRRAVVQSC